MELGDGTHWCAAEGNGDLDTGMGGGTERVKEVCEWAAYLEFLLPVWTLVQQCASA